MAASGQASPFLDRLPQDTRSRLDGHLESVFLHAGDVLIEAGVPVKFVHFLNGGLATINLGTKGREAAVAFIGREGFTAHCLLLGRRQSSCNTIMQIGGEATRIPADLLMTLADEDSVLRLALLNGVDDLLQQISGAALANAQMTVEARLARLLLMASDRLTDPAIPLTHDRIASMLGCRRAGVTMGMHLLEGEGAIRATRAKIVVRDRTKLHEMAGDWRGPTTLGDMAAKPPVEPSSPAGIS